MKEIIILYELSQIDRVEALVGTNRPHVLAMNFWVEQELSRRGILFDSIERYALDEAESETSLSLCHKLARTWYQVPEMRFFEHTGVPLAKAFESVIDFYFQQILCHITLFERYFLEHPEYTSVVVPVSGEKLSSQASPFALSGTRVFVDAATFVALGRGLAIRVEGEQELITAEPFPPQSRVRSLALSLYNFFMGLLPRKKLRLFVSDYWSHISPFIETMDEVELVVMDRSEFRQIPLSQLLKHRVRFLHPLDFEDSAVRKAAHDTMLGYVGQWERAKGALRTQAEFAYEGRSWWPVVEPYFDFLVTTFSQRLIADIESLQKIFVQERIQRVVLRASTGGQFHFFLSTQVARLLDIPSIDLLHGAGFAFLEGPESYFTADYMAGYGPMALEALRDLPFATERIVSVGSPRFDLYGDLSSLTRQEREDFVRGLGLDPNRPTVMVGMPAEYVSFMPSLYSSYEIIAMLRELREVQQLVPTVQFVLKYRAGPRNLTELHRAYIRSLFSDGSVVAINIPDVSVLVRACDIVLVGNSTLLLESLMVHTPTLVYPVKGSDSLFTRFYKDSLEIPRTPRELSETIRRTVDDRPFRDLLVSRADTLLATEYSFDGHAAEHIRDMLRSPLRTFPER